MFFSTGILIPCMGIRHLIGISGMTGLTQTEAECRLVADIDLPPCPGFRFGTDIHRS